MAVSAAVLIDDSQTCVEDEQGNLTYTATYLVASDTGLDGPQVVKTAAGLPAQFESYSVGNDSDNTCFCVSRVPRRRPGTFHFDVICTWTSDIDTPRDQNGNPTNNPEQ